MALTGEPGIAPGRGVNEARHPFPALVCAYRLALALCYVRAAVDAFGVAARTRADSDLGETDIEDGHGQKGMSESSDATEGTAGAEGAIPNRRSS